MSTEDTKDQGVETTEEVSSEENLELGNLLFENEILKMFVSAMKGAVKHNGEKGIVCAQIEDPTKKCDCGATTLQEHLDLATRDVEAALAFVNSQELANIMACNELSTKQRKAEKNRFSNRLSSWFKEGKTLFSQGVKLSFARVSSTAAVRSTQSFVEKMLCRKF